MNDSTTQLSLFGDDSNNDKPLPEIIADKNNFPLQFHDTDNGRVYAIQDWIRGVAQTETPSQFWRQMQKRADLNTVFKSEKYPYHASDGKTYKREFVNAEGLYAITQRMDTTTGIRNTVLAYLAKAGVVLDEIRLNPEKALPAIERQYVEKQMARGMSESDAQKALADRREGRATFRELTALVQQIVIDTPNYGQLINSEYMAIFDKTAKQLETVLNSKSIRDDLPALQYQYIRTAEYGFKEILKHRGRMTNEQIVNAMYQHARPLGKLLQELCEMLGIDHVTGVPLLNAGGK